MRVLRFLDARRMVLCLGLLALMAVASGCSDENPVSAVGEDAAKEKGESLKKARQEAYGKAGVPVGRPKANPPEK